MNDTQRLIEGVIEDPQALRISELEAEIRKMRRERDDARLVAERAQEDAHRALSMLRQQLGPLYRALQAVFGELDAAGVTDAAPPPGAPMGAPATDARVSAVWDAWKAKLPPACGKIIDALLLHRDLNSAQIKVAARLGTSTVSDAIWKLNKAGLIDRNGGRVSLKQL